MTPISECKLDQQHSNVIIWTRGDYMSILFLNKLAQRNMGTWIKPETNTSNENFWLGKPQCTGNAGMATTADPVGRVEGPAILGE